ncbi:flagellar M-ring protein FliF [Cereibacter changlensis JA139]|uniref:Flagellar M-ring protein n=2 Tax=Cereibacter changlensis TaxID=402884 RepID=A0A2T4JYE8_9RHOB|nr:flagellar basal-body MS-ring/collar protein FliF [Cereibacter changlensis]PTE22941.1 flagellar M-ring protein FliF [Cereibacter changlensis JA139]PZX58822.1 flagellar M-ring protein FliF [Cereibacter changlensis]
MQNLLSLWNAMDARRRVIVLGATLAMFLAVLGLSRMASAPSMALLYAGLDSAAAGEVVTALEQQQVPFEIRGNAIYVDGARRDELRMTLAGQGLPAAGAAGYELLDGLSGFGTTSQMFDAAYLRAKEGELARTILASPQIRAARVHIAQAPSQPFRRDERPTASVTVTSAGGSVSQAQARAFKHLVAAAVSGMLPADVAVVDSVGGLVRLGEEVEPGGDVPDRAEALRRNVERLLAARVGPGRAVVEVSLDVETERESIVEQTYDPQGRVPISSETQERSSSATQPAPGVTVASNLPQGDAAAGGEGKSSSSETRETVNFEVSQTQREVLRQPGAIRRLSVAVLVDGVKTTAEDGTVSWAPRPEEELAVLRDLVASAVGLDEERGDKLTLRSLAFEPLPEEGTAASPGLLDAMGGINLMSVLQLAVLALVALILGLFVLRPLLTGAARGASDLPALPPPSGAGFADGEGDSGRVLTGEIDDEPDLPAFPMMSGGGMEMEDDNDPVARLRRLIEERQTESVEILRGWMELEREK